MVIMEWKENQNVEVVKSEVWKAALNGYTSMLTSLLWNAKREVLENEILNGLITEADGQKTTPLIIAVCKGNEEIVNTLLIFGVDLERTGMVLYGNQMNDFTALCCASGWGYYNIVKILVANGANVNHTTETGYTPLGLACHLGNTKIVQYLIEHSANINAVDNCKRTCLMEASAKGYYEIVTYLLEKGADLEYRRSEGTTALHESAQFGHLSISKLLTESGLKMTSDKSGMTPLMTAAIYRQTNVVEYLSSLPACQRKARAEALALLGTAFLFQEKSDLSKAYRFLWKALIERQANDNDRNVILISEITGIMECQTEYQLETIRKDKLAMCLVGLAIRERILGSNNLLLTDPLLYTSRLLLDKDEYDKCIKVSLYAAKIMQNHDQECSVKEYPELFAEMFEDEVKINFASLLEAFHVASRELELDTKRMNACKCPYTKYETDVMSCICLIGFMLMIYSSKQEENQLYQTVYDFLRQEIRLQNGFTLLHICCDANANLNTIDIKDVVEFPNILLCKILAYCGANVNATDNNKNTPLHIIGKCGGSDFENLGEIIDCLIEHGAHVDAYDRNGMTPADVARTCIAVDVLKAHEKHMQITLKCLAARAVMKHKLTYITIVPESLYEFIELH